jgi:hypothetical protein
MVAQEHQPRVSPAVRQKEGFQACRSSSACHQEEAKVTAIDYMVSIAPTRRGPSPQPQTSKPRLRADQGLFTQGHTAGTEHNQESTQKLIPCTML